MTDKKDKEIQGTTSLADLRRRINAVNHDILELLNKRAGIVQEVVEYKERNAIEIFIPTREQEMLDGLVEANPGPFSDDMIRHLFREIFRVSLRHMEKDKKQSLQVTRRPGAPTDVIPVGDREVGRDPIIIAGPCAVESEEQMERVASRLAELGVTFLRGGAFKPRTSPYSFQGLGEEGLLLLEAAGKRHGLMTVTEVVDTRTVDLVAKHADMLQIGSRNQLNYELLKAVATTGKPILLKRGFAATLDELMRSAEYIVAGGNENVILCERGIRTFARETRNTLDITAIPLLGELCRLPVIVDISHAAGRRDILPSLARASLAAGANGIMVEVHPNPGLARSDAQQQLDLDQFERLLSGLTPDLLSLTPRVAEQSAE